MATHSSILAWEIPWTEEPGCLQSMGSQRVGTTKHTQQKLISLPIDIDIVHLQMCKYYIHMEVF